MTELWVTLMATGAWALAAGSAGLVGSFLAQHIRDRQVSKRTAEDRFGPSGVERPATAKPGVAPASDPALVLTLSVSTTSGGSPDPVIETAWEAAR